MLPSKSANRVSVFDHVSTVYIRHISTWSAIPLSLFNFNYSVKRKSKTIMNVTTRGVPVARDLIVPDRDDKSDDLLT